MFIFKQRIRKGKDPTDRLWNVKIIAPTKRYKDDIRVLIGGRDVTEKLVGFTYELTAGKMPKVTLTFVPKRLTVCTLATVQAYDVDLGPFSDTESKLKETT